MGLPLRSRVSPPVVSRSVVSGLVLRETTVEALILPGKRHLIVVAVNAVHLAAMSGALRCRR